ncbi:MAG: hypothetical protein NT034_04760 [Candidatus Magasanikbacteria bacterium]|nr:hypothetical protein [Candidatus Magasanikbacteria bacterium]
MRALIKVGNCVCEGSRDPKEVQRFLLRILDSQDLLENRGASPPVAVVDPPASDWKEEWSRFYGEIFGRKVDLTEVDEVPDPGGFGWVMFVANGLTLRGVIKKCQERFPISSFYGDDADVSVPTHVRDTCKAYSRRFRNRVEADEENKSVSPHEVVKREDVCTLLERLLLELWYHWRTGGGHLDLLKVTVCAGSKDYSDRFPRVSWRTSRLKIYFSYHAGRGNEDLRVRSVR